MAPTLIVWIKIQKENNALCPVINSILAPTYKSAKHLTKEIMKVVKLPYTFVASNWMKVANKHTNQRHTIYHGG
jgi:hypothetical protein